MKETLDEVSLGCDLICFLLKHKGGGSLLLHLICFSSTSMAAMTRGIVISLFMSFFMEAKHTCLIVYELEMS